MTKQEGDKEQNWYTGLSFHSSATEEMGTPMARTLFLEISYYPFAVTDVELTIDFTNLSNTADKIAVLSGIESVAGVVRIQMECCPLLLTWAPSRKMVQPRLAQELLPFEFTALY